MPIATDMFFAPSDRQAEQQLIPGSEFRPVAGFDEHLALFGTDADEIAQIGLKDLPAESAPQLG